MKLNLKDIRSEGNIRTDIGDVKELALSIKAQGLIEPLVVKKNGEGYILIAGHRRMAALKSLGMTEVDVHVLQTKDIPAAQLAENLHRKDLTATEVAKTILNAVMAKGFTLDHEKAIPAGLDEVAQEIAVVTGKPLVWVKRLARLAFLPKWAKELLANDNLSLDQAGIILSLPPEKQEHLLKNFTEFNRLTTKGDRVNTDRLVAFIDLAYGKSLSKAPFPLDEPVAGEMPCLTCQWNTSNTTDLFEVKSKEGVCRMAECYRKKCQAVTTELKDKVVKSTQIPFVGYASFAYGYGTGAIVPSTVKGFKTFDKLSKTQEKELEAYQNAKVGKERKPLSFGLIALRASDQGKARIAYVQLKDDGKKKAEGNSGQQYDPFERILSAVQREMRHELVGLPAIEKAKKIKVAPFDAANYLMRANLQDEHFVDMGFAKEDGDSYKFSKDLSFEDIAQTALYVAFMGDWEEFSKDIGLDANKLMAPIVEKLKPIKPELEVTLGQAYPTVDFIKACIAVVKGGRFVAPIKAEPKKTGRMADEAIEKQQEQDEDGEGE